MRRAALVTAILALACTPPPSMGPGVRFALRADDDLVGPTSGEIALTPEAVAVITAFEARELRGGDEVVPVRDAQLVPFLRATSGDDAIVRVVRTSPDAIELRTGRRGSTTLHIVTESFEHDLPVVVAEPSRVELSYATPDMPRPDAPLHVLAGTTARFRLRRSDALGRVLGGDTSELPVRVDPPRAATFEMHRGHRDMIDARFAAPGHVTLSAAGSSPIEIEVVEPSSIASLDLTAVGGPDVRPLDTLAVDGHVLAVVRAQREDGARVFGLSGAVTLTTSTPDVCRVDDASRWYADGVYRVEGKAPGECTLVLALGERTVSVALTVTSD